MSKIKNYISKIPRMMREWMWIFRYIRKYRWGVITYILLGVVAVGMGLVSAVASKYLLDLVTAPDKVAADIIRWISIVIGLALGKIFFNAIASWVTARINVRITNEIREEIFRKIMTSRWESLRDYHSGEIINRLEGDVGSVVAGVISFAPSLVTGLAQFVGAFIIIMIYDPIMAIFALASAPVLVFSAKPLMKIMRKFTEQTRKINGEILSFNSEAFQNIQLVKAFDLTQQRCEALGLLLKEHRRVKLEYSKVSILVSASLSVIGLLAGYACYGWGVYRLYHNVITYGTMSLFIQLSSVLSSSFSSLVSLVPSAVSTATSAGRVMEITQLPAETDKDAEEAKALLAASAASGIRIDANDLCFTYADAETPVMDHVNFHISPGEIVAFVGPSGGGKTTTLRMLLGLLTPSCGSMTFSDGEGAHSVPVSDSTRRLCAYVPQGNSVFSGTIESNLLAVAHDATPEEVEEALRVADAWDFVQAEPEGIKTVLGERGVNLSEGQLQRLSIARAVLRRAPILIMDEATSALDVDTEARVLRNLMTSNPHRICLMTTHRASMLQYADQVYKVNGDGHFEALGAYRELTVSDEKASVQS